MSAQADEHRHVAIACLTVSFGRGSKRTPTVRGLLAASACAVVLGACVSNLGPRPVPMSLEKVDPVAGATAPDGGSECLNWWYAIGDAQLDELERLAMTDAPDLSSADARVRRAVAEARVDASVTRPQGGLAAAVGMVRPTLSRGIPQSPTRQFRPRASCWPPTTCISAWPRFCSSRRLWCGSRQHRRVCPRDGS